MNNQPAYTSLLTLKKGTKARIIAIEDNDKIGRLMLSHGIRTGSIIDILHQRKRGIVIGSGTTRIALGHDVARKLQVERIG
jgi:Fe2+ transport system protein FeoA